MKDHDYFLSEINSDYTLYNQLPETIGLDISGSCNLSCVHCSQKKWYPRSGNMTIETVLKLKEAFPHLGRISLNCNCEPLMNRHIVDIIRLIKKENRDIFISFSTNGMLLHKRMSEQLLKSGINRILFSIEGADLSTYESLRRGARFDVVITNIKDLARLRQSTENYMFEIGITTVAFKKTMAQLPILLDLSSALKVDSLTIFGLEPYTKKMSKEIVYGKELCSTYDDILSEVRENAHTMNIKLRIPHLRIQNSSKCIPRGSIISWNGEVHPCAALSYRRPYYYLGKRYMHPKITFGNINESDYLQVWNGTDYVDFRRRLETGDKPDFCKRCLINDGVIRVSR